jgi:CubicO group peptidase (beta-lactamase class C family)
MSMPTHRLAAVTAIAYSLCLSHGLAADTPAPQLTTKQVQQAIQKLDALAADTLKQTGVPGIAIAVVHQDKPVFIKAYGVRQAGKPEPLDADTRFQVASVSKPIATTVIAALVGQGPIGWDDRVIDRNPDFRLFDPYVTREVRLRDFLCHRSGLPDHAGDLLEDIGYSRDDIFYRLRYQPPSSSFRSAYAYTNFGFSAACCAASDSLKTTWEDVAQQKLFGPLGMKSSSYRFADYEAATNRALAHVKVDGKWLPQHTRQPDAQAPAGGASTTLNDLVLWLRLQLNDGNFNGQQIVAAQALAETHSPQIVTGFDPAQGRMVAYGLGWIVSVERGGRPFLKHSGEFALGVRSEVALLPTEGLGIAILSNAAPTGIPEGLTESFFDYVLDGELQRDWVTFANHMFDLQTEQDQAQLHDYSQPPQKPSPHLPLASYAGKYANDYFGPIEVVARNDALFLRLGPQPMEFPLRHWDRDTFIYLPTGEMAIGLSGVEFSLDPANRASRVRIENLDFNRLGHFTRVD